MLIFFNPKNNPQFEQPPKRNNLSYFRPKKVTQASLSNFFECPPELHYPHKNMETLEKSHIMQWENPISKMFKKL